MQKYTPEHGISDQTLELIGKLNSRGYTTNANLPFLLDVALVRGVKWVDDMYSSTPFFTEAFQRLVGMYVLTSAGEVHHVEHIFPIYNTDTTYAVKFTDNPKLFMFTSSGRSQDMRIVNIFESNPLGEPAVMDITIEADKQDPMDRSTSLPESMAAPYGNELQPKANDTVPYKTIGSQLCTFESHDDDDDYDDTDEDGNED